MEAACWRGSAGQLKELWGMVSWKSGFRAMAELSIEDFYPYFKIVHGLRCGTAG
jgi:hypothetical protein